MYNNNTELMEIQKINPEQVEVITNKRKAWADLGEVTHNIELKLSAMAEQALAKISELPTKIEEIPKAELTLKEVKKELIGVETERKTVTTKLDSITTKLMLSEKKLPGPISLYENAIIKVKKVEADRLALDKVKTDQLKACREYLSNYRNNGINSFNTKIATAVEGAYTWALGEGNITVDGLPKFIDTALTKFKAEHFTVVPPVNSFTQITEDDYSVLVKEIIINSPETFLADYKTKLTYKFADYEIALTNKAQALENSRIEKEAADKLIADKKLNDDIAAKLSSVAINPAVVSAVKPLKSAWKIDNLADLPNSILIMTAFVSNIDLCKVHLKVNVWDSLTILQMKNALVKCKTIDENFSYTGINFIAIDKL